MNIKNKLKCFVEKMGIKCINVLIIVYKLVPNLIYLLIYKKCVLPK